MLAHDDLIVARKYEISSRADLIDRSGRGDLPLKAPQIQQNGPVTEYIWNQHNVPAVAAEDAVPSWYEDFPWVQLSEFETWKDVAAWAVPLYSANATLSEPLTEKVAGWRQIQDPAECVTTVLQFLQDQIRYLGFEGGYNHIAPLKTSLCCRGVR